MFVVFVLSRYCLSKAGLNSVKKLLLCLGKYFPNMNFCPVVPALVSLLLHFSEDEAECFHSVSRLICFNDPNKRYIDQTFLTYHASCMTFGDLANRCCKGIRKLIASSHQNLSEFYSDWITWIFADLPFTYAIRVLDVYLLEGYKVLYRSVAAAMSHTDSFCNCTYNTITRLQGGARFARPLQSVCILPSGRCGGLQDGYEEVCGEYCSPLHSWEALRRGFHDPYGYTDGAQPPLQCQ